MQVIQRQHRRRRFGFRRLFILYFWGILVITFLASCVIELTAAIFIIASNERELRILPLQIAIFLFLSAAPFILLIIVTLFFAHKMGRKISRPVNELMMAVKKIRQQDLDFSIHYQEQNELGELCSAFNELRRELQESLEREWCKQEEMRTLVAALSHDLRTPVTIIQGHIEGLARAEAGEKRNQRLERYLPVLEASSQRMTHLLNDMLLISSLEQTSLIIRPQVVALEEELARKTAVYELQATTHEIAFSSTFHNLAGEPIICDLHRVEQVLDNLFENALRYTPVHGQIDLTCTRHPHYLAFVLRDTGCGLTPQDLPHVFQKFYHGQTRPGEKVRQASGLGLYTCKLLAEKHGGTIAIQNHPAGGCEVVFCLPQTPGEQAT